MSEPLMIRLLSASVAAAGRAGHIIREVLRSGNLGTVQKGAQGVHDPQTEADRKAQRCIVSSLTRQFPGICVIGEESLPPSDEDQQLAVQGGSEEMQGLRCPPHLTSIQEKEVVVWVDPVDGTNEFTEGLPEHVTVLIGISVAGRSVGGVVHQPFVGGGRTVWGMEGVGVGGLEPRPPRGSGLRLVVTRSHYSEMLDQTVKSLAPTEVIRAGGAGNKILMVLEGRADAYVYPSRGTKKWDTCAPEAIVREVGGKVTDIHGRPLIYDPDAPNYRNEHGLVVTMEGHQEILAKIPEHIRKAFPHL